MIYPLANSRWVSMFIFVPKKGGITVVPNDKNELISQRIVTGYRMVIDFRKLNKATRKDHYPLPFIDQMLERLSSTHIFASLMDTLAFHKYLFYNLIKKRPLLLALL